MKEETRKILEKAQAGDAEAQYLTGLYYEDKGDVNEAFQWYNHSAMQGFVYGINAVAIYYLKGIAVKRDVSRASQSGAYIPGRGRMSAGYTERHRVIQAGCGFR